MTRGEDGMISSVGGRRLAYISVCLFRCIVAAVLALPFSRVLAVSPVRGDTITVQINGLSQAPGFFPDFLTLHVNDTVVFVNQALPASNYTISADDGSFSSPTIAPGGRWSFTFISKGAHVYRDTTYPQRMVGELLVVDRGVLLLPTPNPFAEATVIAAIKSRQNPPDTLNLSMRAVAPPASSPVPMILLIIVISGALIVLGAMGFAYYQRYQQRNVAQPDEDQTGPLPGFTLKTGVERVRKIIYYLRQKVQSLPLLHGRRAGDDDDDDDNDWDQI